MIKEFTAVAMTLALGTTLVYGAEVSKSAAAADWSGKVNTVKTDSGEALEIPNQNLIVSKKIFPVEADKTYVLSGSFKADPGSGVDTRFYLGFIALDANKKPIHSPFVNPVPKSDTVLAADAKVGDKTLKIKEGSNWKMGPYLQVAFNTKTDLTDLPNSDLSPKIAAINGDEVTLEQPLKKAYPAGTQVRLQRDGATYTYTGAANRPVPANWIKATGKIKGVSKSGLYGDQWRAGTKYAQVMIYVLSPTKKAEKMQFKDVMVETID